MTLVIIFFTKNVYGNVIHLDFSKTTINSIRKVKIHVSNLIYKPLVGKTEIYNLFKDKLTLKTNIGTTIFHMAYFNFFGNENNFYIKFTQTKLVETLIENNQVAQMCIV